MRALAEELVTVLEAIVLESDRQNEDRAKSHERSRQLENALDQLLEARRIGTLKPDFDFPSSSDESASGSGMKPWIQAFGLLMRLYEFPQARPICDETFRLLEAAQTLDLGVAGPASSPTADALQALDGIRNRHHEWRNRMETAMAEHDRFLSEALYSARKLLDQR